jgi:predicted alpha-1,2-mannosidase
VTALLVCAGPAHASAPAEVDPLIGTHGDGATVPGPQVPFGFANPSPDTWPAITSGYEAGAPIRGFSQTHVSGTGGSGRYGNFRLSPVAGMPDLRDLDDWLASEFSEEEAAPGWYSVLLHEPMARAALTASRRVALHDYRFDGAAPHGLLLEVTSSVDPKTPEAQRPRRSWVRRTGPRRLEGAVRMERGWGTGDYKLFFALRTNRTPRSVRMFRGTRYRDADRLTGGRRRRLGALLGFGAAERVKVKVGLSFRSTRRAARNMRSEVRGFDMERARARAERRWANVLERIEVTGGSDEERRAFATALYHSHVMPHDLSGEDVWTDGRGPHYEDYFTLWDTFRTLHPLLTIIQPERQAEMVQSLVEIYRATGWMPDARVAGNNGLTQGGTNGDVVVADAFVKGLPGIDYRTAYRALRKNAEVDSRTHYKEGRQLTSYEALGYLTPDQRASVSRTMEYAHNDFAVAQVARRFEPGRVQRYLDRSRNWRNVWDPRTRSVNLRGADGSFKADLDPNTVFHTWYDPLYEGSARQYTTHVPHDQAALIERLGGDAAAVGWLDELFEAGWGGYDQSNEPSFLAAFLYIHAGRHDRTALRLRQILEHDYGAGRDGLPGNDDAGAMSSWYVWAATGLFPNAGQPYYYVGSPLFTSSRFRLGGGRSFTVSAPAASAENRYVTGATLNGSPLCRAFITHEELSAGGVLELQMGSEPNGWGDCERPPTLGG